MSYDARRHGPRRVVGKGFHEQVYQVVKRIPRGRVATYGDVAEALGSASVARQVGYALASLPPGRKDVPWHRVVNRAGEISARGDERACSRQRRLLVREGIRFGRHGRIAGFEELRFAFRLEATRGDVPIGDLA